MAVIKSEYLLPNYDPDEVGMKGEKGDDGKTSYVHIAYSNSSDGGVDFSTTDPTNRDYTGYYTDFEMIDSTDPSKYKWQRTKGDSGKDGIAGKDGVGLHSTSITYASHTNASTPPSTGWQAQVPTVPAGQYLWTKTVWTYTDSSSETGYSVAKMGQDGAKGNDGVAGKDGVGIKTTLIEYAVSTSGIVRPTSGWATTIPSVPAGQFLWTRTTWTYTDNTSETGYSVAKMGADGETSHVHTAYAWSADGTDRFTKVYPTENYVLKSKEPYTATGNGGSNQYPASINNILFNPDILGKNATIQYTLTISNYVSGDSVNIKMYDAVGTWATYGGKHDISGNGTWVVQWKGTLPPLKEGGRPEIDFFTNLKADIIIEELRINEGTEYQIYTPAPSEDYANAYPTYIGTYSDFNVEGSDNHKDYTWVRSMGQDGAKGNDGIAGKDGVGIKTTLIEYAVNTSGTVRPTTGWSTTIPNTPQGQYLWTRTTWTYTDNTTEQGYTVARQGANGANGSNGSNGSNGVGISTTIIEYNKSTNSTTPPSTGWTSTIPSISGGQYLWTRVTLNYTDGKKSESYTVARQGEDGADGQLFTGETEPTDFNEGDIWYKVVSGRVTGVYEAKGGAWVEIPFESSVIAETIIGKTIQASHLTGSTIDGGKISGAEFLNEYTNVTSGVNQVTDGKLDIKDGILQAGSTYYLTNSAGERLYRFATTEADIHQGTVNLRQRLYDETGTQTSESTTAVSGGLITLSLTDASGSYNGVLDAKALTKTPWINLTLSEDFTVAENNPPQYRIIYNLDGSRTIKYRGQVQLKSGTMTTGKAYTPFRPGGVSSIPPEIRPDRTIFTYAGTGVGSGTINHGGQLACTASGYFSIGVAQSNTTYASISGMFYDID